MVHAWAKVGKGRSDTLGGVMTGDDKQVRGTSRDARVAGVVGLMTGNNKTNESVMAGNKNK